MFLLNSFARRLKSFFASSGPRPHAYYPEDTIYREARKELLELLEPALKHGIVEAYWGDVTALHALESEVLRALGANDDAVEPVNIDITKSVCSEIRRVLAPESPGARREAEALFTACRNVLEAPESGFLVPGKTSLGVRWHRSGDWLVFFRQGAASIEIVHLLECSSRYEAVVLGRR